MSDKPTIRMQVFYLRNKWQWFWKPTVKKGFSTGVSLLPHIPKFRINLFSWVPSWVSLERINALVWATALIVIPNVAMVNIPAVVAVFDPTKTQQIVASGYTTTYYRGGIYTPKLIYPVGHAPIASPFGWRVSPCPGCPSNHDGVDFHVPLGTTILSAMSGTVTYAGWSNGLGYNIVIDDGYGFVTYYGHMIDGSIPAGIVQGSHVNMGDVIGLVGCTGACTGAHLHFGVKEDGSFVDPMPLLQRYAP